MKIRNILAIACTLPALCACSDWLDVRPSNQVDGEDLFNSGSGYRIALNGIYKQMGTQNLYGQELTWGMVDVLGQQYDKSVLGSDSKYQQACQYLYTDKAVEPVIQSIWSTAYNNIANCNELIKNITAADPAIFEGKTLERDMIYGEALALRALLHFEMLRLFAPSVKNDDGKKYIPYYDTFPSVSASYLTVSEMLEKIEADLQAARELLQTYDDQEGYRILMSKSYRFEGGDLVSDIFYSRRGFRMNYIAIVALQARVFSYAGKSKEAYDAACEVIRYKDDDTSTVFTFTDNSTFNTNPKMKDDLILAFSYNKEVELFQQWDNADEDEGVMGIEWELYDAYEKENAGDMRWASEGGLMDAYEWEYAISRKYMDDASYSDLDKRILPVIRLSEMYYIKGEYLAETDPQAAVAELETVTKARGCMPGKFTHVESLEDYQKAVVQDARKEFIGEGQLYYFFKKYNILPTDAYGEEFEDVDFVFPLPDSETVY